MSSKDQDQARKRYGGKLIVVHCSPDMREAVDQAAEQEMCSASAYVQSERSYGTFLHQLVASNGRLHIETIVLQPGGGDPLYRVPEIVTRGRFPDGGESDSTWRTQEARHVGSDTIAPGF